MSNPLTTPGASWTRSYDVLFFWCSAVFSGEYKKFRKLSDYTLHCNRRRPEGEKCFDAIALVMESIFCTALTVSSFS